MNTVIIMAGINISLKIINCITGEWTEAEIKKRNEINNEIENMQSSYNNSIQNKEEYLLSECNLIYEKRKECCEFLYNAAKEQELFTEKLIIEIKQTIKNVRLALKKQDDIRTPLRRSSLGLLLRQLCETKEKYYSYKLYLSLYCMMIKDFDCKNDPPQFSMKLPNGFPYVGKIIWLDSEKIIKSLKYKYLWIDGISMIIEDCSSYEIGDNKTIPLMITKVGKKQISANIEKGTFAAYELRNTHLGFDATVKEISKKHVILTYQNNLELYLPQNRLINQNRFPVVHSTITVYPLQWEYDLEKLNPNLWPIVVSERREDAVSSLAFSCFPICFSQNDWELFNDYLIKNDIQNYKEEFLIGPCNEQDIILKNGAVLKLQLGNIPLCYLEVDEFDGEKDRLRFFLRFKALCSPNDRTFSADDIYVPFDVTFSPYILGTSLDLVKYYMNIEDIDDVSTLIWDIFDEFRVQNQIRKDQEGMVYYYKWENVTTQLINILEQGDSINLNVSWIKLNNNCVFGEVKNKNELIKFINRFENNKKTNKYIQKQFFYIKDNLSNRYSTNVIDGGNRIRVIGRDVARIFGGENCTIEIYATNRPYAEIQQKNALRQLRIGQVVNPYIQTACMNSANIICENELNEGFNSYINANLQNNVSQKEAVEKAYKEKNIFFIQGPPGTGKTTVIKELVEQEIINGKNSRVLIASQANVAVDNALSGLADKYEKLTVRCGNLNKVSEKFKPILMQNRCMEYLTDLNERKSDFEDSFFEDWYSTIISNEVNDYSPILYELVIRKHRLVGATCVGLAKRNIGLERTEFDLVIIDEAGKALPGEMLIPLIRAKKAIVIGDQYQLPPVINPILYDEEKIDLEDRNVSENILFTHSLFERLYENAPNSNKIMLDTQYRMPSVIGTAISNLFYNGKLKNGEGTDTKKPIMFKYNMNFINFDNNLQYKEKKNLYNQIVNYHEADSVVSLVSNIREKDNRCSIAVITPYKGQKRLIGNKMLSAGIMYQSSNINVETVDSFQGNEADVVIFCTTRAVKRTNFFKDSRRINVALSRAKKELIILGSMKYFNSYHKDDSCLPKLAEYIYKNGNVIIDSMCAEIKRKFSVKNSQIILSLDEIAIPSLYYMEEIKNSEVQRNIDDYIRNNDFSAPLKVKKQSMQYLLIGDFSQYRAATELGVSDIRCFVVN